MGLFAGLLLGGLLGAYWTRPGGWLGSLHGHNPQYQYPQYQRNYPVQTYYPQRQQYYPRPYYHQGYPSPYNQRYPSPYYYQPAYYPPRY